MVMATTAERSQPNTGMAERGDVLNALKRLLDDACGGRGGALFVVGPAGLGKTTVLEHAISVARAQFAIGVGRGDQVEAALPFGLIGQALDQLLAGKLPGGSMALDADGGETADLSVQARFYGILRGIREAAVSPLLLALDDLHWSDPDSLTVIPLICRRLASLPVALIATARPWPTEAVTSAQDLAAQGLAEIQPLAPLSTAAVRELLCSRMGGQVPATVVDQAIDLCGGNPLLVEQVAMELRRSGTLAEKQIWFSRFVGVGAAGQRYLQADQRARDPISGRRRDGGGRTVHHRGRHRNRWPVPWRPAVRGRGRVDAVRSCADPAGSVRGHRAPGAQGPARGRFPCPGGLRGPSGRSGGACDRRAPGRGRRGGGHGGSGRT
jgi:AAA ATPase domain